MKYPLHETERIRWSRCILKWSKWIFLYRDRKKSMRSVIQLLSSRIEKLSPSRHLGNFESVCSRRGIHGPITPAYYYADYTVTRISSLSRLHLEQLAPDIEPPTDCSAGKKDRKRKSRRVGSHDEDTGVERDQHFYPIPFRIERLPKWFLSMGWQTVSDCMISFWF